MRWSIIRLIWVRELRDQLRDRRTLFMIAGLPLLLYPLLGFAVVKFALGFVSQPSIVGIVHGSVASTTFPERTPEGAGLHPAPVLSWLTLLSGSPTGVEQLAGVLGLVEASQRSLDYPLLVHDGHFDPDYLKPTTRPGGVRLEDAKLRIEFVDAPGDEALQTKKVDVLLSAPPSFMLLIDQGERPAVRVQLRENDDHSRQAFNRLSGVLAEWKKRLKEVRLARQGLPADFDDPFEVRDIDGDRGSGGADSLLDLLVRIFPFMLVMWSLAGALYPAVDLCAGEKERGTMETLLISPAGREEIVLGKFLTIWVFSAGTAFLNLASMAVSTWQFSGQLPHGSLSLPALFWCLLLLLPLSAFFSAISLAVGAYARSSKEGQYYLMPLFLLTMPLIFLTLAPGVELNPFYSMVPVTGVGLLMQRLMTAPSLDQVPWFYFAPVLAPMVLYSWLALRWAIEQFQREEVLFREAERLDLGFWLRRLFHDKEALPTTGQAMFCFGLLLVLRWLSLDLGATLPLLERSMIVLLAFVAAPPLFIALLLTTRPLQSLNLRWPRLLCVLAAVLLLPLAELAQHVMNQFPDLVELMRDRQTLVQDAYDRLRGGQELEFWVEYVLALGLLPAVCKEIAFRGLILNGLRRRFRPWTAILLSSFLFAVYHMNVFVVIPTFLLGTLLGLLALRSGSLLPGVLLHWGCNILLLGGPVLAWPGIASVAPPATDTLLLLAVTTVSTVLAALLLWRNRPAKPTGCGPWDHYPRAAARGLGEKPGK